MNNYSTLIRSTGAFLVLWLVISSCGLINNTTRVGDERTETKTVEPGSANEVRVQIKMGAGELSVAGNANSLMDATFRYNVADWKPRVDYTVNSNQGELVVDHQDDDLPIPINGSLINEWNLLLSSTIPIDLEVETGAGQSELDLHELDLTGLVIEIGAGNISVDLSGDLNHDLNATIDGSVGDLTVKLPEEMGVRISANTAIGGLTDSGLARDGDIYVNEAYGSAPYTLYLDIQTGIGAIHLLAP